MEARTELAIPTPGEQRERERPTVEFGSVSEAKPGRTEKGEENEDRTIADHRHRLYGVFDGMGGQAGGAIASKLAAEYVQKEFPNALAALPEADRQNPDRVAAVIREVLLGANQRITKEAQQSLLLQGMATTAALVHLLEHPDASTPATAIIAHVADSRVYRLRNGKLERLTKDHSHLQDAIDSGTIPAEFDQIGDPEADAAVRARGYSDGVIKKVFGHRNFVSTGLGDVPDQQTPRMDVTQIPVEAGDEFIIMSDGIHDPLTDREMERIAAAHQGDPQELGAKLIAAAREVQGIRRKPDDASAVVVQYHGSPRQEAPAAAPDMAHARQWEIPVVTPPAVSASETPPPAAQEWSGTTGELATAARVLGTDLLHHPKRLIAWMRETITAKFGDKPEAAPALPPPEAIAADAARTLQHLDQRTEHWRAQPPETLAHTAEIYRNTLREFATSSIVSPGQISEVGDRRNVYRAAYERWTKNRNDADAVAVMERVAQLDAAFKHAALERLRNLMVEQAAGVSSPPPERPDARTSAPAEAVASAANPPEVARANPELRVLQPMDLRSVAPDLNPAQFEYWKTRSETELRNELTEHERLLTVAASGEGTYTLTGWIDPRGIHKGATNAEKLAIVEQDVHLRKEAMAAIRAELVNRELRPRAAPPVELRSRSTAEAAREEVDRITDADQLEELSHQLESDLAWHNAPNLQDVAAAHRRLTPSHGIQRAFDLTMSDVSLAPDQRAQRVQEILNRDRIYKESMLHAIDAKLDAIERGGAEAA